MSCEGIYLKGDQWSGWSVVVLDNEGGERTTLVGPCMTIEEVLRHAMTASNEPVLIRLGGVSR